MAYSKTLQWACKRANMPFFLMTTKGGARLDQASASEDYTPLHCICSIGPYDMSPSNIEIMKRIITDPCGATTINSRTKYGDTPLMLAAKCDNLTTTNMLIRYGANPCLKHTGNHRHPLSYFRTDICVTARGMCLGGRPLPDRKCVYNLLFVAEQEWQVRLLGEWRPHIHHRFPRQYRNALRTLVVLCKARLPSTEPTQEQRYQLMQYERSYVHLLPEELLQYLFLWIVSVPMPCKWVRRQCDRNYY